MQASNSNSNPDDGASAAAPVPPWLELPDPCLLAVMRCCAAINNRTLLSAARAHSRLRQAAALVLDSITATIRKQRQLDSLRLYLSKHGRRVASIFLMGREPRNLFMGGSPRKLLEGLPANLPRLRSVSFTWLCLQLLPGGWRRGVLPPAVGARLKRLELHDCVLLDGEEGLAAALKQLPRLEHLNISWRHPTVILTAKTLAGAQHLTHLQLAPHAARGDWSPRVMGYAEPRALAGLTQLQHLELQNCSMLPLGPAGIAALLSHLQHLQQLSHLILCDVEFKPDGPPAAAYSALTASSKL